MLNTLLNFSILIKHLIKRITFLFLQLYILIILYFKRKYYTISVELVIVTN